MDPYTDYYAYRASQQRLAELRREADDFRLTRVLADHHAALFPQARRFAAGLIGLAAVAPTRRTARATATGLSTAASPDPCPC